MKGVFVTGTDTGVGKSLVACALLELLRRSGIRTAAMKPVASGSEQTPRGLRNEDALGLMSRAVCRIPYEVVNPYTFEPAIAPHIAAREVGVRMETSPLVESYRRIAASGAEFCVMEGAGGWLVPLNEAETLADLVVELRLPVVLVVGMRLGCLNHALLTAEAVRARGIPMIGWVANQLEPAMPRLSENVETLRRRMPGEMLGSIGHRAGITVAEAADSLDDSRLPKCLIDTTACRHGSAVPATDR